MILNIDITCYYTLTQKLIDVKTETENQYSRQNIVIVKRLQAEATKSEKKKTGQVSFFRFVRILKGSNYKNLHIRELRNGELYEQIFDREKTEA